MRQLGLKFYTKRAFGVFSRKCVLKKCDFRKLKSRESDFVMFDIPKKVLIKILRKYL